MKGGVFQNILQQKSKTFFVFCFCFLLFVAVGSFGTDKIFPTFCITGLFVSLGFVFLFWKNRAIRFVCFCIFFSFLGLVRVNLAFPTRGEQSLIEYNSEKVQMQGFISSEPDVRQENVHYIVRIQKFSIHGVWKNTSQKLALTAPLYPRYEYGENIQVHCELQTPTPRDGFHYEKYLANFGVFSICKNPSITKVVGRSGNPVFSFIYTQKSFLAEKISLLWHEPYASFVAGLLYGYRGGLGSLNEDFNRTGVTHIVAVSGFNITLIASLLSSFLVYLCIKRQHAFWIVVVGICVFVFFTGASASVVRAGCMGILALIARQLGRNSTMRNILIFTVVLMCIENPFVILWDVGFQLSFLSTCGLIYLTPVLEKYFKKVPQMFNLQESLLSTCSAIIFTLPLILFQFGRLSLVAPLVNILILPVIPWVMALGFASVVTSFVFFPLGRLIGFLAYCGLLYIVVVVRFFSHMQFAAVDFELPLWGMVILYGVLLFLLYKNHRKILGKIEKNNVQ